MRKNCSLFPSISLEFMSSNSRSKIMHLSIYHFETIKIIYHFETTVKINSLE